jgi:hypothetical protein
MSNIIFDLQSSKMKFNIILALYDILIKKISFDTQKKKLFELLNY